MRPESAQGAPSGAPVSRRPAAVLALREIVELLRPITTTPSKTYVGSLRADRAMAIAVAALASDEINAAHTEG